MTKFLLIRKKEVHLIVIQCVEGKKKFESMKSVRDMTFTKRSKKLRMNRKISYLPVIKQILRIPLFIRPQEVTKG